MHLQLRHAMSHFYEPSEDRFIGRALCDPGQEELAGELKGLVIRLGLPAIVFPDEGLHELAAGHLGRCDAVSRVAIGPGAGRSGDVLRSDVTLIER